MSKHPNALPDAVARKLSDLAREYGYGIEDLSLSWLTEGIGQPATARVRYTASNDDFDTPLVKLRVEDPKIWDLVKVMAEDVRTRGVMPLNRDTKETRRRRVMNDTWQAYYPDEGETADDAQDLPQSWGKTIWDAEDAARVACEYDYYSRDGWERGMGEPFPIVVIAPDGTESRWKAYNEQRVEHSVDEDDE